MKYDFLNRWWLETHLSNLRLFQRDLNLKNNGYKLYSAIDFYDISKYCFPFIEQSRYKSDLLKKNGKFHDTFYSDYAAGTAMFYFDTIYEKPNLLLSPYISELDEFLLFLRRDSKKYIFASEDIASRSDIADKLKDLADKDGSINYEKFLDYINYNSPYIIYYSSDLFADNLKKFFNLLRQYFAGNTNDLLNDGTPEICPLDSIIFSLSEDQLTEFSDIKAAVWDLRKKPSKMLQNDRDAEAIYTIIRLNELYNNYKKIFIVVSSAPHLNRMRYKNKTSGLLDVEIENRKFTTVRGLDFFSSVLLEIANYQLHNMSKINITNIDLRCLSKSVEIDIKRLEDYLANEPRVGGILLKQYKEQISADLLGLGRLTSNIDLALMIDEFVPTDKKVEEIAKGNEELISQYHDSDKGKVVKLIQGAFNDPIFRKNLLDKYLYMELSSIRQYLRITQSNQKTLSVTLFNIPFELNIDDYESRLIINKIISENIKGKSDIRRTGALSEDTAKNIFELLTELLDRSENLPISERLIIWQLVFLYLGKYSHADEIYNIFCSAKTIDNELESIYLYAVCFVRRMRIYEITERKYFEEIIELCKNNSVIHIGKVDRQIDLEQLELNEVQIVNRRGEKLNLPPTSHNQMLTKDIKLFFNRDNMSDKHVYLAKRDQTKLNIFYIDFRFFHLEIQTLNRYLNDQNQDKFSQNDHDDRFDYFKRECLDSIENNLRTIYIPVAKIANPDYHIAMASDYCYLLSLDESHEKYLSNLLKARNIMLELEKESDQSDNVFWSYVRSYIFGYIYLMIYVKSNSKKKRDALEHALIYFTRSLNELPDQAEYLRKIVKNKLDFINNHLYLLKDNNL